MIKCNEKPSGIYGHYCCGGGVTIDGVRYCSEHSIKMQIDYAGHLFCADLGEDVDENQLSVFYVATNDDCEIF